MKLTLCMYILGCLFLLRLCYSAVKASRETGGAHYWTIVAELGPLLKLLFDNMKAISRFLFLVPLVHLGSHKIT